MGVRFAWLQPSKKRPRTKDDEEEKDSDLTLKIVVWSALTPLVLDLNLRVMGDKSPKATHKQAAQKQAKANAAKKNSSSSSKQVPKPK
jgi:hypothetical protein